MKHNKREIYLVANSDKLPICVILHHLHIITLQHKYSTTILSVFK